MPSNHRPKITIHFARIGKPTRIFTDDFLEDDGFRLKTFTSLPAEISQRLSRDFQQAGLIKPNQQINTIAKFMFYQEYFSIMQFKNKSGEILGIYTDIATPLRRVGANYHLTDLFLDLWLTPLGKPFILDEDEFEQAVHDGLLEHSLAQTARLTLERLLGEAGAGFFPKKYTH